VSLGELLTEVDRRELVQSDQKYCLLGMRWYGKGLFIKDEKSGADIKAKYIYRVEANDVVYNRLFAWKGSFSTASAEFRDCYVSNEYPCFRAEKTRVDIAFLKWYMARQAFWDEVYRLSMGSSRQSRLRLKQSRFLSIKIDLPPLPVQRKIVRYISQISDKIDEARRLKVSVEQEQHSFLLSLVHEISGDAPKDMMANVAPVVRRQVTINKSKEYPELGIRSFGKGTFHKPAIKGSDIGSKRLFRIEPGDLLFSNVFAWEGAIAVAQPNDKGRLGSHRFITCTAEKNRVTADFLCYYFLTDGGLSQIRAASPGAAGRNKTLGIKKLEAIEIPVPSLALQKQFGKFLQKIQVVRTTHAQSAVELDTLLPAVLDRAVKGDL
jgi:type I restriction enzyme S subunit